MLATRSLIKTWRTPEALIDVTLQPVIFLLLFTYIFGGAIAGGFAARYLQFLLPGILGQSIAMAGVALGREPQLRHREGRVRPVPVAADRADGAAGRCRRRRHRRYMILCVVTLGTGMLMGFRVRTSPSRRWRPSVVHRVRPVLLLDLGLRRHARPHAGCGAGDHVPARAAAELRQQHVRPIATMPGWLQTFVKVNPISHLVGDGTRADARRPGGRQPDLTLGWMGALLVVFVPLALRAYRRRA